MHALIKNLKWWLLLGLALATSFIWSAVFAEERAGVLTIAFLDVGQGDATFIEAPNGNQVLIDGGSGKQVLGELAKLLPAHDRSIDVVIATHPDSDHIGGLSEVLKRYDVGTILRSGAINDTAVYDSLNAAIKSRGVRDVLARRGMRLMLDKDVSLEVLFPDRDVSRANPNEASIILRLVYGETEAMLTGDASKRIEQYLASRDGKRLQSDILKVGHHGSKTSSARNFVGFVSPEYAVISASCDNRYGHPHQEVLDTFSHFTINVLTTCEAGTIVFETDGAVLRLK